LAAAAADAGQAELHAALSHLVGQRQHDAGAAGADGVAQRDGAAVDVDDFRIPLAQPGADDGDHREGFVDFHEADVFAAQAGFGQRFLRGPMRHGGEVRRRGRGRGRGADADRGRGAFRPGLAVVYDDRGRRAAAPSLMPGALPAVMQPLGSNTGRSLASFSRLVSRRGASSVSTVSVPPRTGTSTGTISSAMRPPSMAASARWWLRSAHWSCSSRLTLNSRAICSPWLPMWTSPKAHHNPSWMTESSTWPWPRRRPQRASISSPGPRLMLSMPPATTTSA